MDNETIEHGQFVNVLLVDNGQEMLLYHLTQHKSTNEIELWLSVLDAEHEQTRVLPERNTEQRDKFIVLPDDEYDELVEKLTPFVIE